MKIRILTQNPFSVWFWWVEQQALKYIDLTNKLDKKIDIWFFKWEEKDFDILHIIWIHTGINPYWIDSLKSKWIKIIVSSVFYIKPNTIFDYRRPLFYKIFSFIPFHIINWMKQLLKKSDLILPNSKEEWMQLQRIFWINKEKIKVLYNWVDKNYFNWVDKEFFKQKYKLDKYILCVSHIEPRKNHLSLIEWFLEYKKENKNNIKLILFWDYRWNYFSYHKKVKTLISENEKDLLHIKNLKNSDLLFKSAYLWAKWHFLLSSLETPWLSNLEAGIWGIPLVLWKCKPVKEYFWKFAIYINWKNKKQIIDMFKNIKNKENKDQIKFIKNNYSWEKIWGELLLYYNTIWKKK